MGDCRGPRLRRFLRAEWALGACVVTTVLFLVFGGSWLGDLSSSARFAILMSWLMGAILTAAMAVVRHAEALAERLGEPRGTLVLTLAMSGMEMMMISAVISTTSQQSWSLRSVPGRQN